MGFKSKRWLLFRKKQARTIICYAFLTYQAFWLVLSSLPVRINYYEVEFLSLYGQKV